jgi:hypothetical protein
MILFNIFATGDARTVRVMTSEHLQPRSMMRGCLLSPRPLLQLSRPDLALLFSSFFAKKRGQKTQKMQFVRHVEIPFYSGNVPVCDTMTSTVEVAG